MKQPTQINEREAPVKAEREPNDWRELAYRRSGSISVRPCWHPRTDEILVQVRDELTGERFVLAPPKASAVSAFHHPFATRPTLDS